jgi:hypothetical protein
VAAIAVIAMLRLVVVAMMLTGLAAPAAAQTAHDPYRWCAHYSGEGGNGSNCGFMTLEQCRWAISGVGGRCAPNPFFTGDAGRRPERRPAR